MPKGVSIPRPPAFGMPPSAVWQTAQSPAAKTWRPRSIVSAEKVEAAGAGCGGIERAIGMPTAPKVSMPATPPATRESQQITVQIQ
ncbi:hypothetical protein [Mangrovicoccus ximenensis]|uniref:hypothetical protein n=1 Tax=Mangrovicoccus ximenensis TaxID=1911570 RepID=UPI001F3958B2|nr:hypothetical protein [Mangrovicoccus ximenensis]